jgi:hypothetical protein
LPIAAPSSAIDASSSLAWQRLLTRTVVGVVEVETGQMLVVVTRGTVTTLPAESVWGGPPATAEDVDVGVAPTDPSVVGTTVDSPLVSEPVEDDPADVLEVAAG